MSTIVGAVFSILLFVGGMYLFGVAYQVPESFAAFTFVGGIAAISVSVAIPAHLMASNEHN